MQAVEALGSDSSELNFACLTLCQTSDFTVIQQSLLSTNCMHVLGLPTKGMKTNEMQWISAPQWNGSKDLSLPGKGPIKWTVGGMVCDRVARS